MRSLVLISQHRGLAPCACPRTENAVYEPPGKLDSYMFYIREPYKHCCYIRPHYDFNLTRWRWPVRSTSGVPAVICRWTLRYMVASRLRWVPANAPSYNELDSSKYLRDYLKITNASVLHIS